MMTEKAKENTAADGIRLNKYLSQCGLCSRREADQWIAAGRVLLDGKVPQAGDRVMPGQSVSVDGKEVTLSKRELIYVLHKPVGVVCTTDRRWGDELAEDLMKDVPGRVFCVGRLDKASEGLLLMTNQGELADRIMRARNFHEKEYIVTINRPVTALFLKKMSEGVQLEELGVKTRPCQVEQCGKYAFKIILTQGLNRQIRRMCETLGVKVCTLKRVRIMNISLGTLPSGKYRELTEKEMQELLDGLSADKTGR